MATETGPGIHPEAIHHLPIFVTPPGQTDWLFVTMAVFVLLLVIAIGVFYFKLHALPEHMAHRGQKLQYEIVCVLALLAMFTHNHAFWIAGLLLALVPIPDFVTPIGNMAQSLRIIAERSAGAPPAPMPPEPPSAQTQPDQRMEG